MVVLTRNQLLGEVSLKLLGRFKPLAMLYDGLIIKRINSISFKQQQLLTVSQFYLRYWLRYYC